VSGVPLNPGSPSQPRPLSFEHRPSLDGLRAVAALLVLLFSCRDARPRVRLHGCGRLLRPLGLPHHVAAEPRARRDRTLQFVSSSADLTPLVGRVVLVEPLPETAESMIYCLSTGADPDSCALPAVSLPGTAAVEAAWESLPGVTTISVDDLICPLGTCPAMVNGIPAHRDSHHLAGSYARYLAHPLDACAGSCSTRAR
jgi:SGNH domain (fused to AT3 domains)